MSPDTAPNRAGRPIVLAGLPRCGSTWTKEVLERDPSLLSLMEPDSEGHRGSAIWAKRPLGRYPVLAPGDDGNRYRLLWSWILQGVPEGTHLRLADRILELTTQKEKNTYLRGDRSLKMSAAGLLGTQWRSPTTAGTTRRLLVKTVHAPLSLEWVASEFDVDVVVVIRHPGSILASWLDLDFIDRYVAFESRPEVRSLAAGWDVPLPGPDLLEVTIWRIGLLATALEKAVERHPSWVVRTHEELCTDPVTEFRKLFGDLGLTWTPEVETHLSENDREGKGFRTQRRAADLPDNWKSRLDGDQKAALRRVLSLFPLTRWSADDLAD
jgi:hypothetical protein